MSQQSLIYTALLSGPKSAADLAALGVNPVKLTARMADLRRWLQAQGMDWLNVQGTYELVKPEGG